MTTRADWFRWVLCDRARGAMLGLALGDALGASVEFMTPREIQHVHGVHAHIQGGGWLRLKPGAVTDDTTMSFALAHAWLEAKGPPDAERCAMAFDAWMRSKPVDIGNTVRRGIVRWRLHGTPVAEVSEESAGNGGVMRCLPVALATVGAKRQEIHQATLTQARVTHHNPLADLASLCVVDMVQIGLCGGDRDSVLERARLLATESPVFNWCGLRCDNPSGYVVETLRAVFQALNDQHGFRDVLVDVVNRGGDADTTGAIAGMIAGAQCGESGLPPDWLHVLDAGVRHEAVRLADALIALSPILHVEPAPGN